MSVLIKGMEMPVTCCHCPLMGYDPDREWFDSMARTGAHICVLTGELIDNTKREDHCPLVPVPPHGRLIDADALHYSRIRIAHPDGAVGGWNAVVMSAEIKDAPTIIPVDLEKEGET